MSATSIGDWVAPSGEHYEVRQAWCLLQVKLCDPCLSALKWFQGLYTMQGAIQVLVFTFTLLAFAGEVANLEHTHALDLGTTSTSSISRRRLDFYPSVMPAVSDRDGPLPPEMFWLSAGKRRHQRGFDVKKVQHRRGTRQLTSKAFQRDLPQRLDKCLRQCEEIKRANGRQHKEDGNDSRKSAVSGLLVRSNLFCNLTFHRLFMFCVLRLHTFYCTVFM